MRRPAPLRLTALASLTAAAASGAVLLAPAASADEQVMPGRAGNSSGVAQSVLPCTPPFGRKL